MVVQNFTLSLYRNQNSNNKTNKMEFTTEELNDRIEMVKDFQLNCGYTLAQAQEAMNKVLDQDINVIDSHTV